MKRKTYFYSGIAFFVIGVGILAYYFATGEALFNSFDEVTQIQNARIHTNDEYIAKGNFELVLLGTSILSFIIGFIMIYINKKTQKDFDKSS